MAPNPHKIDIKILSEVNDVKIKSSPGKPIVPGKPIFDKLKKKKQDVNLGKKCAIAFKYSIFQVPKILYKIPIEKNKAPEIRP
mgnify:CR=1 FL=1